MARGVAFRGKRADARSVKMIEEAERLGGPLTLTQGAYNGSAVSASAGTHAGGGTFDFSVRGLTPTQINRRVRALRRVGFAAWLRTAAEGPWSPHIHAVAVGCPDLASIAARQVDALRRGRSGLASNGPDRHRGMRLPVVTWEAYLEAKERTVDLSDLVRAVVRTGDVPGLAGKALKAEGLPATKEGYARWQRRMGYRGADADGLPGMTSLRALGKAGNFEVTA